MKEGDRAAAVKVLLDAGANLRARDGAGHTPLYYALTNVPKTGAAELLRSRGARLNVFDAVALGDVAALKAILKDDRAAVASTTSEVATPFGAPWPGSRTPLHVAAAAARSEAVRALIEAGADVNARDDAGQTPLVYAAQARAGLSIRALVEAGANVAAGNSLGGGGAIHVVMGGWHENVPLRTTGKPPHGLDLEQGEEHDNVWRAEAVEFVLRRRADLNDAAYLGLLYRCVTAASAEMVERVLGHRGDVRLDNRRGLEMLTRAVGDGDARVVRLLADAGAPVKGGDPTHPPPVLMAVSRGNVDMLKLLVDCGADINEADASSAYTPLHSAAQNGKLEVMRYLVSAGADVQKKDTWGRTPLDVAADHRRPEDARPLLRILLGEDRQ
jgi:ankyrin repeat protein